ncbi:hypothetical protein [Nannocystis radixulma]|uniref:Glycosyltransferase RgtA/B/C/D-like domain-containing protein n=1 Tax=Nannocystis radixulma TaxID=2995305 RepID=A0ABT5AZA7_9BACT|nr:hypothetical protein [Nannocystis radixulma]MDC0667159.1 hypothetical protein [Nannocystis radixulma]
MPPVLAFAAVIVALARRWQVRCGPLAAGESLVLVAALALGALGLLAALLAVAGIFSGPSFSFTAIALAVLVWPWGQRAPRRPPARSWPRAVAVVVLLAGAAALRWPPISADLGGRDQGTYVLRARHTLRTGRTDHTDPVLARAGAEASLRPGPGDILGLFHADRSPARVGRYEGSYRPGFYLGRRDAGEVVPQFLHLHPSLLALFGLVFGPWSMGLVAPLAGVLSVLALWALGERLWPRAAWSWLAAGLLALSPIAVWTARTPLTESLTGLLVLAAALAVARGLGPDEPRPSGASDSTLRARDAAALGQELTAALLLGLAGFVRGNLWLSAPAALAVLWLRPEPGLRRMSAPTLLFGLLLASLALHAATTYPYLHDEFKRQLGPLAALSLAGVVIVGLVALAIYLVLDVALDRARGHVRRLPLVLAGLAGLAGLAWLALRAPGPPWSRLDPVGPLLGAPLLLAAGLGLVAFARLRPPPTATSAWLLAIATLPVTALALYAQRNLPQVGLYYYGRYLVPELLPAACLLAALALSRVHTFLSERTGLGRHARWVSLVLGLGLLGAQALPYARAPATRLQEFAGADRMIDDLAAEIPERAVVLAGGEGWHHIHVFSQLGGALAFGHGRTVLPYRDREAAYAVLHELLVAGPAASGDDPPPVYLLLGEATHPLRIPGEEAPLALVDDLLPPPFVARPVAFAELYFHRLTPVDDRIPDRVTRSDLRVGLLEVTVDPARRAAVRSWRIDNGRAEGPDHITLSSYYLPDGQVCLDAEHPTILDLPPGAGPGSLVLVAHPGADTPAWQLVVDGQRVPLDAPGPGPKRARDTIGPIPFASQPRRIELWGSERAGPDPICPHGGLAELRLLGPDRGPDDRSGAWSRTYAPPDDLGHRVTPARFAGGRALSRLRPGLDPARELDGPSLVVRAGDPLTFPVEHVPKTTIILAATLRAARLSPAGRVRVLADGVTLVELDPPDSLDGVWHAPLTEVTLPGPAPRLRVEVVDPERPDAHVALRDLVLVPPPG